MECPSCQKEVLAMLCPEKREGCCVLHWKPHKCKPEYSLDELMEEVEDQLMELVHSVAGHEDGAKPIHRHVTFVVPTMKIK